MTEDFGGVRTTDNTNPKDALGIKKSALRLVPPALVIATAPVMALGAKKYGPYNWREKPVKLTVYLEAMLRHILAVMDGEDLDVESNEPHVAHIAAGAGIILDADAGGTLIDDRPRGGPGPDLLDDQDKTIPRGRDEVRAILDAELGADAAAPVDSIPRTDYHRVTESSHDRYERHTGPNYATPGVPAHRHEDGRLIFLAGDSIPSAPEVPLPFEVDSSDDNARQRFLDLEGIGGSEL